MLLAKKCQFFLYLNLIKLSLEMMLSDFAKKEKPCLALKNRIFQSPKNPLFQTCHFFSLFRFDQNNTRNNAF